MAVTKEQWGEIEQRLQGVYGRIKLSLQGRLLTLEKRFVAENQLAILVFIDGEIRPAKGLPSHDQFDEFIKQVWRERSHSIYPPKQKQEIIKTFGKRGAKKHFPRLDDKVFFWTPDFRTFGSLRRKLQKLPELDLVGIESLI